MELPTEGPSASTLHLPISLQFKESLHLSALGMGNRFVAQEGRQCSGSWNGWEPGPGRSWRGKAPVSAPSQLWDLRHRTRVPWTDCQGRRDKGRDPLALRPLPANELWAH